MGNKSYKASGVILWWIAANFLGFAIIGVLTLVTPLLQSIPGWLVTSATEALSPLRPLLDSIPAWLVSSLLIGLPLGFTQWLALRRILKTSKWWIISISIGLLIAIFIGKVIPDGFGPAWDDESIAALTVGYFVGGFAIGLPQWLILRQQLRRSSIWLLGSSIGTFASAWFILVTDLINLSGILSIIIGTLIYSIITGLILSGLLAYNDQSQNKLTNTA